MSTGRHPPTARGAMQKDLAVDSPQPGTDWPIHLDGLTRGFAVRVAHAAPDGIAVVRVADAGAFRRRRASGRPRHGGEEREGGGLHSGPWAEDALARSGRTVCPPGRPSAGWRITPPGHRRTAAAGRAGRQRPVARGPQPQRSRACRWQGP